MKTTMRLGNACLALTMIAGTGWSQADKPIDQPSYYHLDFAVKELEGGKTINARSYSMEISTNSHMSSSIRTGSRVPVPGKDGAVNYIEMGINIDCRMAREVGNQLALEISADISNVAEPSSNPPVIRNTKWGSTTIIPIRKPTTVFSSDDPASKRQMQLEVTATPIK
jgi:hypothetical protein